MRTYFDCIPCFFKQALEASKLAGASFSEQRRILNRIARALPAFSLAASPPEMGRRVYKIVCQVTGKKDPYRKIKEASNGKALRIYPRLKTKVRRARDPLGMAVELAIAGNIIDYGIKNTLNVDRELNKILRTENRLIKGRKHPFFQYSSFRSSLDKSKVLLYLADNAGEIVFDRILIEEIRKRDPRKKILFAVKTHPTINDALIEDARCCGIDRIAEIVQSGSDAPGTILSLCTQEFRWLFQKADMVISKGQGNFESLSTVQRPVFFLFMAKCIVVARHIGCSLGDIILQHHVPGKMEG